MIRPWGLALLWLGALSGAVALLATNFFLGNLNQDEGWYLYAARQVALGRVLYRDFAFTQGPMLPVIYAWIQPWVDDWGLGAGRAFTALLGLGVALAAALLAARLAGAERGKAAALIAFTMALVNVQQSYYCTVVKTYSLTALFLTGGFLALAAALPRRGAWMAAAAGALLLLAGATRTSAGIVLPLALALLFLERRRLAFQAWLWMGLGAGLAAGCVFLPFLVMAPEAFRFWVVDYHTLRAAGSFGQALVFKAGFLSRLLQAYFVAIAVWIAILCAKLFYGSRRPAPALGLFSKSESFLIRLLWISIAAVSLLHLGAPFPYEDYQVFVYPLFAVVVAVMAIRFVAARAVPWLATLLLLLSLGSALSSPVNQDWFILGRDRIWWRMKTQTALGQLQETGALLRSMSRPGEVLLTQDPYLAVESGLSLPHGLEMGQFSYFPGLSQEQAERFNVLNRETFETLLKTSPAPLAAFSGYAFAMRSPQLTPTSEDERAGFWRLVEDRYQPVCELPDFGQAFTTLRIFRLQSPGAEPQLVESLATKAPSREASNPN